MNLKPSKRICCFESRRANEMKSLIERNGDTAFIAPSMQEVPLECNDEVVAFAERLLDGKIDIVIFETGVGARYMLDVLQADFGRDEILNGLRNCITVVRGPKPAAVFKEWDVKFTYRAPEPNTWQEVVTVLAENEKLKGKTIAVQEYGLRNDALHAALEREQAKTISVPVYRWGLPDDTRPLEEAIQKTIRDEFDLVMFTSAQQLAHVLQIAEKLGMKEEWLEHANRCTIASIGPTTTEALKQARLNVALEASPSKMGHLVKLVSARE